jgi:hypothetical protein
MPRDWTPREMRLVAEWAVRTYPAAVLRFRVDVGDLRTAMDATGLSPAELRRLGRSRRWVDAMIVEPAAVHLVEAKINLVPGALEQLELYRRLFPKTPELAHLRDRRLELHVVYAVEDPVLVALARERGVRVHLFRPPWVDAYLAELAHRARRAPQPRGLEDEFFPEEPGEPETR